MVVSQHDKSLSATQKCRRRPFCIVNVPWLYNQTKICMAPRFKATRKTFYLIFIGLEFIVLQIDWISVSGLECIFCVSSFHMQVLGENGKGPWLFTNMQVDCLPWVSWPWDTAAAPNRFPETFTISTGFPVFRQDPCCFMSFFFASHIWNQGFSLSLSQACEESLQKIVAIFWGKPSTDFSKHRGYVHLCNKNTKKNVKIAPLNRSNAKTLIV